MASRKSNQLTISTSTPTSAGVGDEWFNPTTNSLQKLLVVNNQVSWQNIVLAISNNITTTTSQLYIANAALSPSFTTNTGALVVEGGVGIGGNLNVGGTGTTIASITTITNTTAAVSNATGALQVRGGLGVSGAIYAGSAIVSGSSVNDSIGNVRTFILNTVGNYNLVAADNGKLVSSTGTVTVPANIFSAGQNIMVHNSSSLAISITTATGLTMWLAGTNTEGSRTLAARGVAQILCITTQTFVAWGTGLT